MYLLEAECAVATAAIEMGVLFLVVYVVVAVLMADIVFQRTAAVVDSMDKTVEEEERKGARYRAFIDSWQQLFQSGQRKHFVASMELLQNKQTRSGRLDVVMLQVVNERIFVLHFSN